MSVNEKVLDAIEYLTSKSIAQAGYDKTIQAQIISCQDATVGKYKCKYQDSQFFAFADNIDTIYTKDTLVYILVPQNDMEKEKTIIGTVGRNGINQTSQYYDSDIYENIGTNCISFDGTLYLDSNNKDYKYCIYNYKTDDFIDNKSLQEYVKKSSAIMTSLQFKTQLSADRVKSGGNYGIIYKLCFQSNSSQQQVIRDYYFTQNDIVNTNPFLMPFYNKQSLAFSDIDKDNFVRVNEIWIYNNGFANATGTLTEAPVQEKDADIFFTRLQIMGANRLTEQQISGTTVSFSAPLGTVFKQPREQEEPVNQLPITAQLRIKGKIAKDTSKMSFYWGCEDINIKPQSLLYNKNLGRGWRCLNEYTAISTADTEGNEFTQVEWVPGTDTILFQLKDAAAAQNKVKVVVLYDGQNFSRTLTIENKINAPKIEIKSNQGTKFYFDNGMPTLTCYVNEEDNPSKYIYKWGYENAQGILENISINEQKVAEYKDNVSTLNQINEDLKLYKTFPQVVEKDVLECQSKIKQIESQGLSQRIEENKLCDVNVKAIVSYGVFKCSVYTNDENQDFIGTASIKITNAHYIEGNYSLVINNSTEVFSYDEDGVAPTNQSLDIQQELSELTFTIYDNLGNPLSDDIIGDYNKNCQIEWLFPIRDTMLIDNNEKSNDIDQDGVISEDGKYISYKNHKTLSYDIASRYDIRKSQNQIYLNIIYKGMSLAASTNFTFVKEGQPGTNGTDYIVKIIPNVEQGQPIPAYPMITSIDNVFSFLNYKTLVYNKESMQWEWGDYLTIPTDMGENKENKFFKPFNVHLYRCGKLVWASQGYTSEWNPIENPDQISYSDIDIKWSILKNEEETSPFILSSDQFGNAEKQGIFKFDFNDETFYRGKIVSSGKSEGSQVNIVKCTLALNGKQYFATMPIITSVIYDDHYKVKLKESTGFNYVLYASDGTNPTYDNIHPFEFLVYEDTPANDPQDQNKRYFQDVSTACWHGDESKPFIEYEHIEYSIYDENDKIIQESLLKCIKQEKNKFTYKPNARYDGYSSHESIIIRMRRKPYNDDGTERDGENPPVAAIKVPIHFLLNKYGFAHLNDWDGNSIKISDNGGYILSPQMGAGKKANDNSFTGLLMGQVKENIKSDSQVGLFGYNKGERTLFLNSENGSALFGKNGNGQIVIDPDQDKALLYSSAFWKEYNSNGLPNSYSTGNQSHEGLLIDLTTPQIRYGNDQFKVDKDGNLTANSGTIGGWKITDVSLYSNVELDRGRITLSAGSKENGEFIPGGKFYSDRHVTYNNTSKGFYLGSDGISFGDKVRISNEGVAQFGDWKIDKKNANSYIAFGGEAFKNSTVYLGTDGISLGKGNFWVDKDGKCNIGGGGTIGGWKINADSLSAGNIFLNGDGSMSGGKDDKIWSINKDGSAQFTNISLGSTGGIYTAKETGALSIALGSVQATGMIDGKTYHRGSLGEKIKELAVDSLFVTTTFSFHNKFVKWQQIKYVSDIMPTWSTVCASISDAERKNFNNKTSAEIADAMRRGHKYIPFYDTEPSDDGQRISKMKFAQVGAFGIPYNVEIRFTTRNLYILTEDKEGSTYNKVG